MTNTRALGVAEAKARLSELIERVGRGERFVVLRRGKPALGLVRPDEIPPPRSEPTGLAAVAGALAEWEDLPDAVDEIYAARERAKDRPAPQLD
jgi:antitoxin (DNA-binding transcriptional repressor) of toxin-antitoxin stability system